MSEKDLNILEDLVRIEKEKDKAAGGSDEELAILGDFRDNANKSDKETEAEYNEILNDFMQKEDTAGIEEFVRDGNMEIQKPEGKEENIIEIEDTDDEGLLDEFFKVEGDPGDIDEESPEEKTDIIESDEGHDRNIFNTEPNSESRKTEGDSSSAKPNISVDVMRIKNMIESFLEIVVSKKASYIAFKSDGKMYVGFDSGNPESDSNPVLTYKNLYSFSNYVIPRLDFDIFISRNIYRGHYMYGSTEFVFTVISDHDDLTLYFVRKTRNSAIWNSVLDRLPIEQMHSSFAGTVNIVSGFSKEYASDFLKAMLGHKDSELRNVVYIYDNDKMDFQNPRVVFSTFAVNGINRKYAENILRDFNGDIIINCGLSEDILDTASHFAFAGRNVFLIINNNNSVREITEYLMSLLLENRRRRIFIKYLVSSISLNLIKIDPVKTYPVFDFVYFDKKIKRPLLDDKFDIFHRELAENNENIISFEHNLNDLIKKGKITQDVADDFLKSLSWTIE